MKNRIILKHGGYQKLLSYQKTRTIYDLTVVFCNRFLNCRDRTVDQMIQAARSGKQNIVEGCMASGTSKEMEIKLVNIARSSLEELREDYQDYLRTHRCHTWSKTSTEAIYMRKLGRGLPDSHEIILELVRSRKAQEICNMAICLIHQANYLLDNQLRQLEQAFLKQGGLRERMYHARKLSR